MNNLAIMKSFISLGLIQALELSRATGMHTFKQSMAKGILQKQTLTHYVPITTPADNIHKTFSLLSEKIRLDISCESSARQRIHMKLQALLS